MTTQPTDVSIDSFLSDISEVRRQDAYVLIGMMQEISGLKPCMWGPSIIGFGSRHYKYETGHEGDMPVLSFSPRKANLTVYFEGFDAYGKLLEKLGKYKNTVSCLYINKLPDVDLGILRLMLEQSYGHSTIASNKPTSVEAYIRSVPASARPKFDELRTIVTETIPAAKEVLSYGILGYKIDDKRPRVFISGWKDHLAIYPVPKDETLRSELVPFVKGKGTLWLGLNDPLPKTLIRSVVEALVRD